MFKLIANLLFSTFAIAAGETYTANMNMPIPAVGVTKGPQYAQDINNSLLILDKHNHSPGYGVPITPSGLNISSDLTMQINNLTNIRSTRFSPLVSPISGTAPDIGELYVAGSDLYYNDVSGNQIRITQSGSVAGASGTITGLPSGTASAAYQASPGTFQFLQSTGNGGNIDAGTYILRYPGSFPSPSGNYVALQAPATLSGGYSLTFPTTVPSAQSFVTISNSGSIATPINFTQGITAANIASGTITTTQISASAGIVGSQIASTTITASNIANNTITRAQLAGVGPQISATYSGQTFSASLVNVGALTANITTTGRPVVVSLISDGTSNASVITQSVGNGYATVAIYRDGGVIATYSILAQYALGSTGVFQVVPTSSVHTLDPGASAGAHIYTIYMSQAILNNVKLMAYEL